MGSTLVDRVIQRYELDDRYTAKAKKIEAVTDRVARSVDKVQSKIKGFADAMFGFGGKLGGVAKGLLATGAAIAAVVLGLGITAVNAAGDMDSLKRGLMAVSSSTQEMEKRLTMLKEVAKLPGLGLKEAIQSFIDLVAAGVDAGMAERSLKAFGNALATVGRGKDDLEGVLYGLRQLASSPSILAEDLNIIRERVPQVADALKKLYGSSRGEDLVKMGVTPDQLINDLLTELEKLPKVTGGIKNTLENLGDTIFQAFATAGEVLATWLIPNIELLADWLSFLNNSGLLTQIVEGFVGMFNLGAGGEAPLITALAFATATLKNLPEIVRSVGNYIGLAFQKIGGAIGEAFKVAFAIFLTAQLIQGIAAIVKIYQSLAKAIAAAAAAQTILTSATGVGIAVILGAIALGAGVYAGLNALIGMAGEGMDGIVSGFKALPGFEKIAEDAEIMKGQFQGFRENANEDKASDVGIGKPGFALRQIAKNTADTARNTKEQLDIQRYSLGGGDLGKWGVTPLEIRRMRGQSASSNITVDGADEALNEFLSKFLRRALPLVIARSGM